MRVVLSASWSGGGSSQAFRAVGTALADAGHEVWFFSDRDRDVPPGTQGFTEVLKWPRATGGSGRDDLRWAVQALRQIRPDVTTGSFARGSAMVTAWALARVPRRVIWYHTLSSQLLADSSGPRALALARMARKRLVYGVATDVVAISGEASRDLVEAFHVPARKITVQHNAIADGPTRPELTGGHDLPAGAPVVIVGRLDPSKGHATLVRAAAKAASRPALVAIGEGPEAASLAGMAADLGVDLELTGTLPYDEVRRRMAAAALVAVPSLSEAFGRVAGEGLAAGVPVVASRAGGLREVVHDGVTGRLVPPGDSVAFAAALDEALDPATNRRWGDAARADYLDRFEITSRAAAIAAWLTTPG